MRHTTKGAILAIALGAATALAAPARAQEEAPADTTESLEAIEARLLGELGEADTTDAAPRQPRSRPGTLNPDISLIGDILADLSPDGSTIEGGDRFQLREIELGVQSAVDPYFRFDAFVAFEAEEVDVEEAYATTLSLPANLQVKAGKMLLPMGKVNLTHVPELDTVELPLVHQEFFGEEGFKSSGVWLSVIGRPLGFFQEISFLATNGAERHGHGEDEDDLDASLAPAGEDDEEGKDLFDDLADRLWVAHLKNSIDLTPASNLELGASWGTSAVDEPVRVRTNLYGVDAIWRWKPLRQAKYRSAMLQTEWFWRNEAGTGETWSGGFVFGQWQLARRWFAGARYDRVELLEAPDETLQAGQLLVRYFPTEFSQIRLAYERQEPEVGEGVDRLLLQTTFALGPHRPHPF